MKRLPRKLPLSLLLWTAVAAVGLVAPDSSWSRPRAAKPKAVVTRLHFLSCHDGDTCRAKNPEGLQLTVRFLGLDAPEVAPPGRGKKRAPPQPFALEARDELRRRVVGKTLPVEIRGSDPYNRYLALIWESTKMAGPTLNEHLVYEGYAFAYRNPRLDEDIRAWSLNAEKYAREAKRGIWSLKQLPLNPADYRKTTR